MVTKASGEFLGHTICTDRTPGFSKTAKSTAESRWMPISMLSLSRNLAHGSIAANAFGSAPPPDVSLITYEDVLGRGRRNCPFSQATAPPWSSAPCGRYLRIRGGWNRRLADIAQRGLGRLNWADCGRTGVASGRIGARAIAAIRLRARNMLHRPKQTFVCGAAKTIERRATPSLSAQRLGGDKIT
jgi:hypothetical protein